MDEETYTCPSRNTLVSNLAISSNFCNLDFSFTVGISMKIYSSAHILFIEHVLGIYFQRTNIECQ